MKCSKLLSLLTLFVAGSAFAQEATTGLEVVVDGWKVGGVTCADAQKVVQTTLLPVRAALDGCSAKPLGVAVRFRGDASQVVFAKAVTPDPKISACVEKALRGAPVLKPGTCVARFRIAGRAAAAPAAANAPASASAVTTAATIAAPSAAASAAVVTPVAVASRPTAPTVAETRAPTAEVRAVAAVAGSCRSQQTTAKNLLRALHGAQLQNRDRTGSFTNDLSRLTQQSVAGYRIVVVQAQEKTFAAEARTTIDRREDTWRIDQTGAITNVVDGCRFAADS